MYAISSTVFMAGPIPLILTSCLTSLYKIRQATILAKHISSSVRLQRQASITIVIVTTTYLVYNVPVFINYIAYTVASFHSAVDYKEMYGSNSALFYYSWVITYIVCVALNAVTNPLVYFFRMTGYRKYVMALCGVSVLEATFSTSASGSLYFTSRREREPSNFSREMTLKANPVVTNNGDLSDGDAGTTTQRELRQG